MIMLASAVLIVPAAMAAVVVPFGFESGVPTFRQLFSVVLVLSPIILLIAGLGALFALQDRRWVKLAPLTAFAVAGLAQALFWSGI